MSLKFKDTKQDHVGIFSPKWGGVTPFPQPVIYKDNTAQASLHKAELKIMSINHASVLVCFGQFRFWMGIVWVARWNGLEILIWKHMWKSKIRLPEQR